MMSNIHPEFRRVMQAARLEDVSHAASRRRVESRSISERPELTGIQLGQFPGSSEV